MTQNDAVSGCRGFLICDRVRHSSPRHAAPKRDKTVQKSASLGGSRLPKITQNSGFQTGPRGYVQPMNIHATTDMGVSQELAGSSTDHRGSRCGRKCEHLRAKV